MAISQGRYVRTILERFGMQDAKPVDTPGYGAEISAEQPVDQLLGPTEKKLYQSITGSILYLAQGTRFATCPSQDFNYPRHATTRHK